MVSLSEKASTFAREMKKLLYIFIFILTFNSIAQNFPYKISIDSIHIPELGGLQSFAVGQHNGKWLLVGGRLDGLHRRQPFASFDLAGHNNQLVVVDPVSRQKWTRNMLELDTLVREQLSSSNMQFVQKDNILYLIGGYGICKEKDDHISFPYLTTIDLEKTINAIIKSEPIKPYIHQQEDEHFAVTGGQLFVFGEELALVGGHRFDGRYHPMNGPTFVQEYKNGVTFFEVNQKAEKLNILNIRELHNEALMHRRDFNVQELQLPNGDLGLIAFSGVFQKEENIPYLNAVLIQKDTMIEIPNFAQYYNHYHCANLSFVDYEQQASFHLFMGGIAQYYDSIGMLVADNEVPFTSTISIVVRDTNKRLKEYLLPIKMPGYLGAASEFIINPELPLVHGEIINLNKLQGDSVLLGYIYGGINSSAANIFWINTGVESIASQMIYPVYLVKGQQEMKLNVQSEEGTQLQVFPKPLAKEIVFSFNLRNPKYPVQTVLMDKKGEIVAVKKWKKVKLGPNTFHWKVRAIKKHVGGNVGEYTFRLVRGDLEWGYKDDQIMLVR